LSYRQYPRQPKYFELQNFAKQNFLSGIIYLLLQDVMRLCWIGISVYQKLLFSGIKSALPEFEAFGCCVCESTAPV
ncbi:MAG: hypothetical protein KDD64_07130, partial [Bdellovibrionales bacterium]|nr:hypothetical protein [Bdellovibrionales bacterium]